MILKTFTIGLNDVNGKSYWPVPEWCVVLPQTGREVMEVELP